MLKQPFCSLYSDVWGKHLSRLSTFDFIRGGESQPNLLDGKTEIAMQMKGQVALKYVSVLFGVC